MAGHLSGVEHAAGHEGLGVGCPISCLGVVTIADLLRVLAEPGRLVARRSEDGATPLDLLPHVHEQVTLSCPVFCLNLSARVLNALRCGREKVETVGDLLRLLQSGRLADVRNIGPRRVGEVRTALIAAGFRLPHHPCPDR